jgi:glycosyltransferase involved in cell wall biosynthesis
MKSIPQISVIIPAYNSADYIGNAIESALAQTCPPLEILVVDDGSTDDTAQVVASYPSPVRLLRQANGGPASARNHGAREAHGDWLALLDADDTWLPHKLEQQMPAAMQPAVGLIANYPAQAFPGLHEPVTVTFEMLWQRNRLMNSTVLIRRAVFEQLGGFDEDRNLICVEDYNLWLRVAAADWQILAFPEGQYRYTPAPGNLSSQIERYARAELHNLHKITALLNLDQRTYKRKQVALYKEYGSRFLYYRQLRPARSFLCSALRAQPSSTTICWWLATFLPSPMLDWRRHLLRHD